MKPNRTRIITALKSVVASNASFLSKLSPFLSDPKLVENWDAFMQTAPLSTDMDSATDEDLFDAMVQHGVKGWEHLSDYYDLSDWQSEVDDWSDEWTNFANAWLVYRYGSFKKDFERIAKFKEGKLEIYRCIEIPKDQTKRDEFRDSVKKGTAALGIYWTWDYGSARCFWGKGGGSTRDEVVLTGLIDPSAMNAGNTFYKNLHPLTAGEGEIELHEGTPITITGIGGAGVAIDKPYVAKASHVAALKSVAAKRSPYCKWHAKHYYF